MGLTNWKHAPDGKILKSDVLVAKNYLNEQHIKELNRIVSAYLDLAESRAERRNRLICRVGLIFCINFWNYQTSNFKRQRKSKCFGG